MLPPDTLDDIRSRIEDNRRIGYPHAKSLLDNAGLNKLQVMADLARKKQVGERVSFINNYHLYYTNICIWGCKFCAFSRRPSAPDAYAKTTDDIAEEISQAGSDVSEVRVTGGINPKLDLNYYKRLLSCIRDRLPKVHIEAFAPTEVAFMAYKSNLSVSEVLLELKNAGLGSLTSGGAEIFNPELRKKLCPRKTSIAGWISITKTAHRMGIPSNASILFGHLETHDDWLDHLFTLRRLQDETGGFNSFVPLCFLPANTEMDYCPQADFSEVLRMIAISRVVLDNFKHIKFLWIYYGSRRIKEVLKFGANDLAGTANEKYKGVARSARSGSPASISRQELVSIIKDCRRLPVERGKLYEEKYVCH